MHTTSYANTLRDQPRLPDWVAGAAADVQELYLYWNDCRAGHPLPRRRDIDFAALATVFPHVLLADVNALRETVLDSPYRYRPIGQDDFDAGRKIGERGIAGLDPALFRHIPVSGCAAAITTHAPHTEHVGLLSGDGLLLDYDVVFLPLAGADGAVDGILILAVEIAPRDHLG